MFWSPEARFPKKHVTTKGEFGGGFWLGAGDSALVGGVLFQAAS
jgi:hypothetical protein